uniref:Uncharacterized protein n=1 Tax=Tolypothrix bouteillei VB521301 TaxID=1479485 RepID=A0A0C1N8D0_9CYAN
MQLPLKIFFTLFVTTVIIVWQVIVNVALPDESAIRRYAIFFDWWIGGWWIGGWWLVVGGGI